MVAAGHEAPSKYDNIVFQQQTGCLILCGKRITFRSYRIPGKNRSCQSHSWKWDLIKRIEVLDPARDSSDRILKLVPKKLGQKAVKVLLPSEVIVFIVRDVEAHLPGGLIEGGIPNQGTDTLIEKVEKEMRTSSIVATEVDQEGPEIQPCLSPTEYSDEDALRDTQSPPRTMPESCSVNVQVDMDASGRRTEPLETPERAMSMPLAASVSERDVSELSQQLNEESESEHGSLSSMLSVNSAKPDEEEPMRRTSRLSAILKLGKALIASPIGTPTGDSPKPDKQESQKKKNGTRRISLTGLNVKLPVFQKNQEQMVKKNNRENQGLKKDLDAHKPRHKEPKRASLKFRRSKDKVERSASQRKVWTEKKKSEKASGNNIRRFFRESSASKLAASNGEDSITEPSTPCVARPMLAREHSSISRTSSVLSYGDENELYCLPIYEEELPGFNPEWHPGNPENDARLMMFKHAAMCSCATGACELDPDCSDHKKILDHMDVCEDPNVCGHQSCFESKQFLTIMQILMQEFDLVSEGQYHDFLVEAGVVAPVPEISFTSNSLSRLPDNMDSDNFESHRGDQEKSGEYDDETSMSSLGDVSELGSWGVTEDEYDGSGSCVYPGESSKKLLELHDD